MKIKTKLIEFYDFISKDIPRFFKNIFLFRKELRSFQWWDYHYTLDILKRSLEIMSDNLETKGLEVECSRLKKVQKIRRAIQIIENFSNGVKHIEMAEEELGKLIIKDWEFEDIEGNPQYKRLVENLTPEERYHNGKIYSRTREIEESEWNELWEIFKGKNPEEYKNMNPGNFDEKTGKYEPDWDEWFDGSGMRGWWD
jgi:hypothetical protein